METKKAKKLSRINCPLCSWLLFKANPNSNCEVEIKCKKCDNIVNIKIENKIAHFENERIKSESVL